jgi:hypothetical protein
MKPLYTMTTRAPHVPPTQRGHSELSSFVRRWHEVLKVKRLPNMWLERGAMEYERDPHVQYVYRYPDGFGYGVSVCLSPCRNHPDKVIVGCSNWRAEHEPNGVIDKRDARRLAKALLERGAQLVVMEYEVLPGMHDALVSVQWRVRIATDDAVSGTPSYKRHVPAEQDCPPLPFTPLWEMAREEADRDYPPRDWVGLLDAN